MTRSTGTSLRKTLSVLVSTALALGGIAIASQQATAATATYGPQKTLMDGGSVTEPAAVAVTSGGDLLVSDVNRNQVLRMPAGGSAVTQLPFSTDVTKPGVQAFGVAADAGGNVYAANNGTNQVMELPVGASVPTVLPFTGLNQPYGVAVDGSGDVFVADLGNSRVVELTPQGVQRTLPFPGLYEPAGIAVDTHGAVYVTDYGTSTVQELPAGASVAAPLPFTGLAIPTGVAVDADGTVYVADNGTSTVQALPAGAPVSAPLPFSGLMGPWGVAVDDRGDVYVTNSGYSNVLELPNSQAAQTITNFTPTTTGVYGGTQTLTATGGGGTAPVVFSVDSSSTAGVCAMSNDGATLTYTGVGTCVVDANQAGDSNYSAAPQVQQTITVNPAPQAITAWTPATHGSIGGTQNLVVGVPISTSPVVFSVDASSDPGVCAVSGTNGSILTYTGAGSCVVDANEAADSNYAAAPQVTRTILVGSQPVISSGSLAVFAAGTPGTFTITTSGASPSPSVIAESGALPAGVTFHDNGDGTATLAGTPAAGTGGGYWLTITADNGIAAGTAPRATQSFDLEVTEPATITSPDHVTFTKSQAGSFTVTTSHSYPGQLSLTSADPMPAGLTFTDHGDGTATIAGTPAYGGVYLAAITVATGPHVYATQTLTIAVDDLPVITGASVTGFTVGTPGTFTVTTTPGTPASLTLAETGALPTGVTFHDNGDGTATLAGTPAAGTAGLYDLKITANNGVTVGSAAYADKYFALWVLQPPVITSADHATATVGAALSFPVTSLGTPALTVTGTLPAGVTFTDHGDGTGTIGGTPAAGSAGSYPLTISGQNGIQPDAAQAFTLTVAKASQTITVTSGDPGTGTVGGRYTPAATSDSGLPVTVTLGAGSNGCAFDGAAVTYTHAGTCVINFAQPGNDSYTAADTVTVTVTVGSLVTTATLTPSTTNAVYGQPVTVDLTVVAVTSGAGSPTGTVQFAVDGTAVGGPVPVTAYHAASGPLGVLTPGAHTVTGAFTPTDPGLYAASSTSTTVTVAQAATTTAVTVRPSSVSAAVTPTAPGSGTPGGTVSFSVDGHTIGTAALVGGIATLPQAVASGAVRQVAAVYSGDPNFTASSASTARQDPAITAAVTSRVARNDAGWYRTPVTIRFTCTPAGSALTGPCPAPVTLTRDGAAQSVTRTVTAVDGGAATVTVTGINLDQTAPAVSISGVRNGAVYAGTAPTARCVGRDALSGVASCTLRKVTVGQVTTVYGTVVDRAGNSAKVLLRYSTLSTYLPGARYDRGAFDVQAGHTYTLTVTGGPQPRYYDAAVYPGRPGPAGPLFHRASGGRWTLGVTIDQGMRSHPLWSLGIKVGTRLYTVLVRVS